MSGNLLKKSYINNSQSNNTESESNDRLSVDVFNISIFHRPPNFLNLYAKIKAIIAEITFPINKNLLSLRFFDHSGTITVAPIQPADKLAEKSERVRYQAGSIFITKANLAVVQIAVNQTWSVAFVLQCRTSAD